ncbi:MAG: hypothetical protein H6963_02690 [Chromatiaceae bacterium]|nr:hypothetical protein [Chromatiaceae bacterium]MCP5408189.1 hypothetical protein [Chromatiaceae bacterium]MCP5442000.1 hypothetical protein [Chromatiaceae bacterium]
MSVSNSFDLGIERFSKGIDNTRIDVVLSPKFMHHTQLWIRQKLSDYTADRKSAARTGSEGSHLVKIKEAYTGMMVVAVDLAKKKSRPDLISLLQLSVVKFLSQVSTDEVERLQAQMQQSRDANKQHASGRAVEIHERLVALSKEDFSFRYRVIRKLFREIQKLEEMSLFKIRKSVLEIDWPVPQGVLFNPLLQIPSVWADEQWMCHYPLAFNDRQDPQVFDQVNRLVAGIFHDYLPDYAWPAEISYFADGTDIWKKRVAASRQRQDREVLNGLHEITDLLECSLQGNEYEQDHLCWLDTPENMICLLNSAEPRRWRRIDPADIKITPLWDQERWPQFHNRLLKRIFRELRRHGLGHKIIASYAAPSLYQELEGRLPVRLIYSYLSNMLPRRALVRRLRGIQPPMDVEGTMRLLDSATVDGKRLSAAYRHRQMLRFLVDFTVLRRDLKLAYRAHQIMNGIRVLTRSADIDLSRDNATLNEFVLVEEQKPEQNRIRSHVVLKADVRGSTDMIRELRKRKLNPASHFSRNFFEPINRLLSIYGAKKTFVEGDAVILSLYEYEESKYQWLCVSLACGLARKILQVVDARNVDSRKNGLPELELGLGIAFLNEAPTFLSDEDREIMISPAINRADQLSSCSALLRKSDFAKGLGRGVEVVAASGLPILEKDSSDRMMRYNVNGIELDTPAFVKLQSELALNVVRLEDEIYPGGARFYVGKYADMKGENHWLVVREAPVRVWKGGRPGEGEQYGHRFYQVVTDADVISRILTRLNESRDQPKKTDLAKSDTPPPTEMHYEF